ncbi:1-deoxy-D-xylulose-5-phosphate reductoisomerase [Natronospira proteinivora]|uniref:1-deoxy-D-xylulose 5-phosphate reductoisomerase n=1 Tax=Natronospira proteinivora TaxID=1807133 RepID=A0ABT1G8I9_9GAMM|nr:1-deoxy-D-xylulose-5-phosphate reductoisomerase [Natronospira proteinivora]MCP1726623.1 1-deoxy-D-xylulose-5-phosphate reductoisomerase [Natronospira proteinivora]
MKSVVVLGATGSVGRSTLNVLARHPDRFRVAALTANTDHEGLLAQCLETHPELAVLVDSDGAAALEAGLRKAGLKTEVLTGPQALVSAAELAGADVVMAAIVGAAGLLPTLAAVKAGKRVLVANKEPLVMCGGLFMSAVRASGAELLPIDSEHNAIFQCLPGGYRTGEMPRGIRSVLLTASGGPFRDWPLADMGSVTPAQACKHPNWSMGRKISVDSATMMNKGLELIEACHLFSLEPEAIRVVLHPESIIHSMVEYADGSLLAQMGQPDMRTPIACGLSWPERIEAGVASLDPIEIGRLNFQPPDHERFPALKLAESAIRVGEGMPVVLNAANEVAVADFLAGRHGFMRISERVDEALNAFDGARSQDLDTVLALDTEVRHWMGVSPREGSA